MAFSLFLQNRLIKEVALTNLDTSCVMDMSSMFDSCSSLEKVNVSNIDTSKVTTFGAMFFGCRKLSSIDVSNFKTGVATNFASMFRGCSSLESLDLSHWEMTETLTNMSSMFFENSKLKKITFPSKTNLSNVTNLSMMFTACRSIENLDLSSFDTSNVKNMAAMFQDCLALTSLDVSYFDTKLVSNMRRMFFDCTNLLSLDLSNFASGEATSPVDMTEMFFACSSLKNIAFNQKDILKASKISSMFHSCSNLKEIDLSFFDTETVNSTEMLFTNCVKLENIQFGKKFKTDNVSNMSDMFANCRMLKNVDVSNFRSTSLLNSKEMFKGRSQLEKLDLSSFDCIPVDCSNMFTECSNLHYIDLRSAHTRNDNSTAMTDMFSTGSSGLLAITSDKRFLSEYFYITSPLDSTTLRTDGYTFKDDVSPIDHQYLTDMGKINGNNGCAITPDQATALNIKEWMIEKRQSIDDYYEMVTSDTANLWQMEDVSNFAFEDVLKAKYRIIKGEITFSVSDINFGSTVLSKNTLYTQDKTTGKNETVTVSDTRYTNSGWQLSVSCSPFINQQAILSSIKLKFSLPNVTGQGIQTQEVSMLTDNNSAVVLSAKSGKGKEKSTLIWGEKTLEFPSTYGLFRRGSLSTPVRRT